MHARKQISRRVPRLGRHLGLEPQLMSRTQALIHVHWNGIFIRSMTVVGYKHEPSAASAVDEGLFRG